MASAITYDDYLKLKGLLVLAAEHNRALKTIERAAATITGAEEEVGQYFGLTSDEVYMPDPDADELLRRLDVTVEEPVAA